MVERHRWVGKRGWTFAVLVLLVGATGCAASEDSKRAASGTHSQVSQGATPPPHQEEPELTSAHETALAEARDRIDSGGLSKTALIQHMTAEGWYRENVTFAANNVGADWKQEAVEQARGRMSEVDYSRRSLFDHLLSDGFTRAEAEYAVSKAYD